MSICEEIEWYQGITKYCVKGEQVSKIVHDEVKDLERQLEEAREIIDNLLVTDEDKRWLAKVLKEKGDE